MPIDFSSNLPGSRLPKSKSDLQQEKNTELLNKLKHGAHITRDQWVKAGGSADFYDRLAAHDGTAGISLFDLAAYDCESATKRSSDPTSSIIRTGGNFRSIFNPFLKNQEE